MKDKISNFVTNLKTKIGENKVASIIAGVLLLAVVVGLIVLFAGGDDKGKGSNTASSGNASAGNLVISEITDDDDSKITEGKEEANESGSSASEETKEGETTMSGETSGNSNGNTASGNSGNSGNSGINSSGSNGGGTSDNGGQVSGGNTSGGSQGGNSGATTPTGNPTHKTETGNDTPVSNQGTLYEQLFSIDSKVTIEFRITDENIKQMQQDYEKSEDIYRPCTMIIDVNGKSYTLYEVGIRLKGNTSRVAVYNNGNINDRNLVHFKVKFNETFDNDDYGNTGVVWKNEALRQERKNRTFADLEGLELKWNRNFDSTFVANVYANDMFRALGVPVQRTGLSSVKFGGYNYGVYTIYEPVDEVFLERNFGSGNKDGDLYKCSWGQLNGGTGGGWSGTTYLSNTTGSIGVVKNNQDYIYALKTNKKKSTHAAIKKMISTLNSGNVSKKTFASVVDTSNWVKFAAVSYFIGDPDDMRNNYNNHYVYFGNDGKAKFITYDNDRCLGISTSNKDMSTVDPYSTSAVLANGGQKNPLYLYSVTGSNNNYTSEYTAELKRVYNSGWLEYSKYKTYYEKAKNNYSGMTVPDSNIKARIEGLDGSVSYGNISKLTFAESNGENMAVSKYLQNIKNTYSKYVK